MKTSKNDFDRMERTRKLIDAVRCKPIAEQWGLLFGLLAMGYGALGVEWETADQKAARELVDMASLSTRIDELKAELIDSY